MSHHAQWVSMDTVLLKEEMKSIVKRVFVVQRYSM